MNPESFGSKRESPSLVIVFLSPQAVTVAEVICVFVYLTLVFPKDKITLRLSTMPPGDPCSQSSQSCSE